MAAKKPDEYTAAIREADAARKQISTLETQVLEQMEAFESAEKELAERAPEVEKLRGEMEASFKAFDEQTKAQQQLLEAGRAEHEKLLRELPKATSALYNRISARIRDGVALAEARNGACMACYMSLRPQVMADVRRGEEIITCDNCNRILYYATEKKAEHVGVCGIARIFACGSRASLLAHRFISKGRQGCVRSACVPISS
jgi:predicted  nucleic acid-binding Zn-ribbon protein